MGILKQTESGVPVSELYREHGITVNLSVQANNNGSTGPTAVLKTWLSGQDVAVIRGPTRTHSETHEVVEYHRATQYA